MKTTNKYEIANFATNPKSYLRLRYLLGYMADTGYLQVDIVEKEEWKKKYAWIIYSWDVEIIKPLKDKDKVTIMTQAIRMNRFYAYRNFTIEREGEIVAKAYCVFLLVDVDKKRPVKVPKEMEEAYGREESIYDGREVHISDEFTEKKKLYLRKVDLDVNGHVNNTVYMDLLADIIDIADEDVEYIKIVYKNEIRNKDFVIGESIETKDGADFRLSSEDGKVYTYGKIIKRHV